MKNIRSICFFIVLFVLLSVLCGCSEPKTENLLLGKYIFEDSEEISKPYVLLKENNKFIFEYSVLSSYFNYGTYKVENDTLILTTEDEAYTFVFKIDNGNLYFNSELSTEIIAYKEGPLIGDGSEFVLYNKK